MDRALVAMNRFGLGSRPGDEVGGDPAGWLLDNLKGFSTRQALADKFSSVSALSGIKEQNEALRTAKSAAARSWIRHDIVSKVRAFYQECALLRINHSIESEASFAEHLVHFWSNHFAVSIDKIEMIALAGPYEFEAIRPNIGGKFADLLMAVTQHPGMLLYLDQVRSSGPSSPLAAAARSKPKVRRIPGMNENLAREILELHTLGVNGGYGQPDVIALAKALTGWTVTGYAIEKYDPATIPGRFVFRTDMHEGAAQILLGTRYPASGRAQAERMLRDLSLRPETAEFVCSKLARHFVSDVPDRSLVAAMVAAWRRGDGNLPTVYRAMLEHGAAWSSERTKFRTPWEWLVAALRGLGLPADRALLNMLVELGQPVWRPMSPAGFPDVAAHWATPGALQRRVEAAQQIANRTPKNGFDVKDLSVNVEHWGLSDASYKAIRHAESDSQAISLLLVSPEILYR